MDPLCEFPSREFYHGQLKPSPMLKNYSYPRLAHFWPKGTGHSVHTEDGVHTLQAGWVRREQSVDFSLSSLPRQWAASGDVQCEGHRGTGWVKVSRGHHCEQEGSRESGESVHYSFGI